MSRLVQPEVPEHYQVMSELISGFWGDAGQLVPVQQRLPEHRPRRVHERVIHHLHHLHDALLIEIDFSPFCAAQAQRWERSAPQKGSAAPGMVNLFPSL